MNIDINSLFLIINSIVTCSCGGILAYFIYDRTVENHLFYYAWSVGFILYGIEIIVKSLNLLFGSVLMLLAFLTFSCGLWSLSRKKAIVGLLIAIYCFLIALLPGTLTKDLLTAEPASAFFAFLCFYLPITLMIIYHRAMFGGLTDRFTLGWLFLLLVNIFLFQKGWIADVFAIFAKSTLLLGIIDHNFIILTQRVREELAPHRLPINTGYEKEGGLKLVMSRSEQLPLIKISEWARRRVEKNAKQGVKTSLVVLQNVIPHDILRRIAWINPDRVHVFVFSQNPSGREEFTTLKMGITEIGATLTEITKKYAKEESKGEVILVDLSILIHTFGVHETYNLILNKMGTLRSYGVPLVAVFHPETHEKSVISLFKTITDSITQL